MDWPPPLVVERRLAVGHACLVAPFDLGLAVLVVLGVVAVELSLFETARALLLAVFVVRDVSPVLLALGVRSIARLDVTVRIMLGDALS